MDYPEWDITSAATLDNVSFKMFTEEEILKLSVKEINVAESFDMLLHPVAGGMYDPALGSTENEICCTCGQTRFQCMGHFGHIRLPLTCFNPSTFNAMWNILRHSCLLCHKLSVANKNVQILQSKLLLLETGQLVASQTVDDFKSKEKKLMTWIETFPVLETKDGDNENARHLTAARLEALHRFMNSFKRNCPHCEKKLMHFKCISQERIIVAEIFLNKDTEEENAKRIPHIKSKEIPVTNICYRKSCVTPVEAKQHLRKIWENDGHLLQNIYACLNVDTIHPTDVFFLDVLPVTPSCFRPPLIRASMKYESMRTSSYIRLLSSINYLKSTIKMLSYVQSSENSSVQVEITNLLADAAENNSLTPEQAKVQKSENLHQKVQEAWVKMQNLVNCLYNSKFSRSKIVFAGVKQVLERKDGLFRKHMMGKRVNYAARSVITPDPNISISEIGVPKIFAMTLTYPQPVTPWNVHELRQMVINGPDIYPGAHSVVDQNGVKRRLYAENLTQRQSIAKQLLTPGTNNKGIITCKKVNRHLIPGDHVLVNRQPTLHKSSMQAHRARIIPNIKTFRLHYANCKAYNADFDGDEMTIHFPQSEAGRAEAMEITSAHNQYLVPKDGTPLAGLIQDHIVSGVRLTIRGRFFTREQYHQLVYSTLVNKMDSIKIVKPAILKPQRLWSGKQVISTLLMNIIPEDKPMLTIDSTSKIAEKLWRKHATKQSVLTPKMSDDMGESHVIINESELLCGVLDKGQYGATSYGLVHCCYELYGGEVSTALLTCLGRLFTNFLQMVGFTLGIKDILMLDSANKKRQAYIQRVKEFTEADVQNALQLKSSEKEKSIEKNIKDVIFAKDDRPILELNHQIKMFTNDIQNNILKATMPNGLLSQFPDNNLQLMVNAGAKGTSVNTMQMSCLLGQIELEGRRPPMMFSGRFLPSFTRYDISPEAGGFVTGRFLTGISPQEYFVHCMAGREGLVDTAVKTSRSGYLQRCLVKHLEGLVVGYDLTVRDSDNSVVQFYYGEDGLDVMKTKLLDVNRFPLLIQNRTAILNSNTSLPQMSEEGKETQERIFFSTHEYQSKEAGRFSNSTTPFLKFCKKKKNSLNFEPGVKNIPGRTVEAAALTQAWFNLSQRKREKYKKKRRIIPEPVMSQKLPYKDKYAISEELYKAMKCYETKLDAQLDEKYIPASLKITTDDFNDLITCKALKSLVQPGESVGVLTSQSIGEPSTQMTLNTFHFAGYGEMNVTLGIPRLREILMSSTGRIKTPTMDIPVLPSVSLERAEQLQKQLTRVTLDMVLAKVEITDKIEMQDNLHHRFYIVKFNFLPPSTYESKLPTNPTKILKHMEKEYLPLLLSRLKTHINQTQDIVLKLPGKIVRQSLAKSVSKKNDGDDDGGDEQEAEDGEEIADDMDIGGGGGDDDDDADDDGMKDKSDDDDADGVGVLKDKSANKNDDDDDDDNDDDDLSEDDVAAKSKKADGDEQDYDDADESESGEDNGSQDSGSDGEEFEAMENSEEKIAAESERPWKQKQKDFSSLKASKRRKMLKSFDKAIHDYIFDEDEQLWCQITFKLNVKLTRVDLLSLVKSSVTKSCIHTVPSISRCLLTNVKTKYGMECHLKTEGINIELILMYGNILDLSRLYCNNPSVMAQWFGIDAGLRIIIKEIQSVFGVYGIKVDYRHLSLVADYMTLAGKIQAFDRMHMASCASLLQQITFESACKCLNMATLNSMSDSLKSPSACIVAGKHIRSGTGSFDLRVPIKI